MKTRANSTFTVDNWDEEPLDDWAGIGLTRTRLTKTFKGDLEGSSVVLATMLKTPAGSMAYVAFEHFTARIGEREGTFVLEHSTRMSSRGQFGDWIIVPDSGTGDLTGIAGTGEILKSGDEQVFQLDYEFESRERP